MGGAILGVGLFDGADGPDIAGLDSHVRYLSGLLLGIGLALWATIPAPERHAARWRLLAAIVFLGGLARAYGALTSGHAVGGVTTFALVMELAVTPALALWRERIARMAA